MDQITKIKLVEEGIQAKADTKVVISISCSDDEYDVKHEPIVVQYDRPFIYMLRNKKTNSIIMAGIYAEPEE